MILPNYGAELTAEELADVAVAAEHAGLDSAWVTDHLVVPAEHADHEKPPLAERVTRFAEEVTPLVRA